MYRGRILYGMLGVNYRTSPIILDEFSAKDPWTAAYGDEHPGELIAGDRAPDAPGLVEGAATTRLLDVFEPTHHTVLIFAPNTEIALDVIEAVGATQIPELMYT